MGESLIPWRCLQSNVFPGRSIEIDMDEADGGDLTMFDTVSYLFEQTLSVC